VSETEKKEKPSQASQVKVSSGEQSQYIPDKTLRRAMIEKADDKPEESKKNE
jgi:hypothetical protein